jgi:uncharacterized protein
MPVRSLNSSVMRWPRPEAVETAAREWAKRLMSADASVIAVAYFGSYARGDPGVGSDLDLIAIVAGNKPSRQRDGEWAVEQLPTPTDLIVYTADEWRELSINSPRFFQTVAREARWLCGVPPAVE